MLRRLPQRRFALGLGQSLTLSRVSLSMGLLGLAFIVLTSAFIAWSERRALVLQGRAHAEQSAFFLADHASRLFEVADIALRAAADAVGDKAPDDWAKSSEIGAGLRSMNDILPYVDTMWICDATGQIRLSTLAEGPKDYSVADRHAFQDAKTAGDRLVIGGSIVGRVSHRATFLLVRALRSADGAFRGAVGASVDLSYFTDHWKRLDNRNDERIAIVHQGSGDLLARYPPPTNPESAGFVSTGVLAAARTAPLSGAFEPAPHRFGYYHRVGEYPLFLSVVFKDAAITALWIDWLQRFLPFVATAFVTLLAMLLAGYHLARRETRARREVERARSLLSASNLRLEQRVQERTAALQETNREIQRFASIVSHDLRAPLVNIMGFTSELTALRDDLFAEPGAAAAPPAAALRLDFDEAIGFIRSSAEKMDRLIGAILSLSRQGQRPFSSEPLDMTALMRSLAGGVAHRAMERAAIVTVDPLPAVTADRLAVEQVFGNLIDNAVKYLRSDVPGRVRIFGADLGAVVVFTVEDNGRGIGEADRDRVFDLFRRAGPQDQKGDGIGLANVRALLRRLGGTITLDSVLGTGSKFTVTLPKSATGEHDGSEP